MKFEDINSIIITYDPATITIVLVIKFKRNLLQRLFNKPNTTITVKQSIINRNDFYIAGQKHRKALKGKPLLTINKILASFIPPNCWGKNNISNFEFKNINGFHVISDKQNNKIYIIKKITINETANSAVFIQNNVEIASVHFDLKGEMFTAKTEMHNLGIFKYKQDAIFYILQYLEKDGFRIITDTKMN